MMSIIKYAFGIAIFCLCMQSITLRAEKFEKTLSNLEGQPVRNANLKTNASQNLFQIYQQAIANDPTWAAARNSNLATHEKINQGKALLLPTVNVGLNTNYTDTNIEYTGSANVFRNNGSEYFDTHSFTVNLRQPIFRLQNNIQYSQSKTQATISDSQLNAAQQDLTLRIAQTYFEVLIAQNKIELIEVQKKATSQQLLQAQANFKFGTGTITDVNDAKAKFDLLLAQEIASKNTLESKKRFIEEIIGYAPGVLSSAHPNIKVEMIEPRELNSWEEIALQNNPEYLAKHKTVELAQQEVERNHAGHLPTLDAVGSYSYTYANGGMNGFGNKLNNVTLGLQLQIPFYQGGAIESKKREAVYNFQKAQDELELSRRKAVSQTRQAWLDLSSSVAIVQAYEQALISIQSQVDATKMAYKLGIRNTVDVLSAEQAFYTAKFDLLEARNVYLTNIFKLKAAAGIVNEHDIVAVNAQLLE